MAKRPLIALVACEESADYLGGVLMKELKKLFPQVSFIGVGGYSMQREGMDSLFPMEKLTALGIVELLHRLVSLIHIREKLVSIMIKHKPDIFIGIDAPDFNLVLAEKLRKRGIRTVHYVSPTVWAWRAKRIYKIARATDMLLCLYPFEINYYKEQTKLRKVKVNAIYVGHPLADEVPLVTEKKKIRKELGLTAKTYIALLPGSRRIEQRNMAELFIHSAMRCLQYRDDLSFIISAINENAAKYLNRLLKLNKAPLDKFCVITRSSRKVIGASDFVLLASGTASLEAMLIKRPMICVYKLPFITYIILKQMVHIPYISQPNWLLGEKVVKEFIQYDANAEDIAKEILHTINIPKDILNKKYTAMHKILKNNAAQRAAHSVAKLI